MPRRQFDPGRPAPGPGRAARIILTNNYLALILPNVTFTLPTCMWTLTAFFSDLPSELEGLGACGWLHAHPVLLQGHGATGGGGRVHGGHPVVHPSMEQVSVRTYLMSQPTRRRRSRSRSSRGLIRRAICVGSDHQRVHRDHPAARAMVLLFQRRIISGLTAGAVMG